MAKHAVSGEIWFADQRVWRTMLQVGVPAIVGLVGLLPMVIDAVLEQAGEVMPPGLRLWLLGAAAVLTAVSGAISKVMAIPGVDEWLRKYTPFGSTPKGVE